MRAVGGQQYLAEPTPLLWALQVAKELESANGATLLQYSQPELNDDGIPQDDEPFCMLLFRDELMDFALERCTEPGRMLDVCSIFQFDVTYNCGEFKVTCWLDRTNPRSRPPGALASGPLASPRGVINLY